MATLAERFEEHVDRSGTHHRWTGSAKPDGCGKLKVDGRTVTARRVAWELAHGPLPPSARVTACQDDPSCVRVEHLAVEGIDRPGAKKPRVRSRKGSGSMRRVGAGTWEVRLTRGRWDDGCVRTLYGTVKADGEVDAAVQLAAFVNRMCDLQHGDDRDVRKLTVDQAIERFLVEYLQEEKGRANKTVNDYRRLHARWFSPTIGSRRVGKVDTATMDRLFGRMRKAGLSASRLNQAKSLYGPFFRWAKRRGMTTRDPMADFQKPTSTQVTTERVPPEVEELSLYLNAAVEIIPEVAPLLVVGAVSGPRRGELVGLRRSRINWRDCQLIVDSAIDGKRLKPDEDPQGTHFPRRR